MAFLLQGVRARLAHLVVAALFVVLFAPHVLGQTRPSPANDAKANAPKRSPEMRWTKVCRADAPKAREVGASKEVLCLIFNEVASNKGVFVVGATLIESPGKPRKVLRIAVPTGVEQQAGARIFVDKDTPLTGSYTQCSAAVCLADFEIDAALFARLRTGEQLTVQVANAKGEMKNLVLSLAGFTQAYDESTPNIARSPKPQQSGAARSSKSDLASNFGDEDGPEICGPKIAGSWDVIADTVFPATLVMPSRQLFKWQFKSDGALGGEAFLLPGGERRRYSCQANSYMLHDFWGITLTLSPDGRQLDGECHDLIASLGGGCRIHAVRNSGRPIAP
jgi:invasion protein IalB